MTLEGTYTSFVRALFVGSLLLLGFACTPVKDASSGSLRDNTQRPASVDDISRTPTPARRTNRSEQGKYPIVRRGDELTIWYKGHDDLGIVKVNVHPNGRVSIPLAGDVAVTGLTRKEASTAINQKLEESMRDSVVICICRISHEPRVSFYSDRVRVTGAVQKTITFRYCKGTTVMDLVRAAGGVTDAAMLHRTALFRTDGSRLPIRLDHILEGSDMTTNYSVNPGDTLAVPLSP